MTQTPNHGYNVPEEGTTDWHIPLNENFRRFDTDVEIRDTEANRTDYDPKAGAKFFSTDTGAVYLGDGSEWSPVERTSRAPSYENLGASVFHPTIQSIPSDTRTPVQFDQVMVDDRDEFRNDSTPHAFVPATEGSYHVDAQVTWSSVVPPAELLVGIYANGFPLAENERSVASRGRHAMSVSKVLRGIGPVHDITIEVRHDMDDPVNLGNTNTYATFTRMG